MQSFLKSKLCIYQNQRDQEKNYEIPNLFKIKIFRSFSTRMDLHITGSQVERFWYVTFWIALFYAGKKGPTKEP